MSRYLKVNDSQYKISVAAGGTITLDTGNQFGSVIVSGDLTVLGSTVTVSTTNVTIEDNIIVLNKGELGSTVTEGVSGIEIDRGSGSNAQFLFDESLTYTDNDGQQGGAFILKRDDGGIVGLYTKSIITGGNDLRLIGQGTGVITVTGTTNYENYVTDDDHIPNKKWTVDFMTQFIASNPPNRIIEGNSLLEVNDSSDTGKTELILTLDGIRAGYWADDVHEVQDLRIIGSRIETTSSNTDLVLASPGTGAIVIDDTLKMTLVASDPTGDAQGIKIYAKEEKEGGSGIFFVNTSGSRDELISKRKSIVYSMIF